MAGGGSSTTVKLRRHHHHHHRNDVDEVLPGLPLVVQDTLRKKKKKYERKSPHVYRHRHVGILLLLLILLFVVVPRLWSENQHGTTTTFVVGRPSGAAANNQRGMADVFVRFLRRLGLTKYCTALLQNNGQFNRLLTRISYKYATQLNRAQAYYEQQRPLVMESAKHFELHPYWGGIANAPPRTISFEALVGRRMQDMYDKLLQRNGGRDDFKVEKDKCVMLNWLERNCLPTPPVYSMTRESSHQLQQDIKSLLQQQNNDDNHVNNTTWPVFLKLCHLTQGAEDSVRRLDSGDFVQRHWGELVRYVEEKWHRTAEDADRLFSASAQTMAAALVPGGALQAGYDQPFELKVQVLWGRAYVAYVMDEPGLITRDDKYEPGCRTCFLGTGLPSPLQTHDKLSWIVTEGHLDRVWTLAETMAALLGNDQCRIDIFIRKGGLQPPAVNEISLNTGQPLHMHSEFAATLWMEGHKHKSVVTTNNNNDATTTTPIYEMSVLDNNGPVPNKDKVWSGLHKMTLWDPTIGKCLQQQQQQNKNSTLK